MESKAGSKSLFYRASLSENRFTLFRTHSRGTAALEFGLAVPLLAILITAIAEIGFSMYQAMQSDLCGGGRARLRRQERLGLHGHRKRRDRLDGLVRHDRHSPTQFCGCPSASGIATATCGTTCSSGQTAGQYIKISVSLTRMSLIGATGFGLPSSFSAQSILRQN